MEKEAKFEKREKIKPVINIETNKAVLETWERMGLKKEVENRIFAFEESMPPGERFSVHATNFASTNDFIERAEHDFKKLGGKNLEAKVKEVENNTRKSILAFAVNDLGVNPIKPEIIKSEEVIKETDGEEKKLIVKYFKTNQKNLLLASDGIDWWLEAQD